MRHKTLFSLLVLCGSTAALAHMAPSQTEPPLQNEMTNQGVPAPETTAPETTSNTTDVEPSTDPTSNGTETAPEPNSTAY
jgi:hypothetical protein